MKLEEIKFSKVFEILEILEQKQKNPMLIIQHRRNNGEWEDSVCNKEDFHINEFKLFNTSNYEIELRIKPEPQYRPYTEVKEEWFLKKVVSKKDGTISALTDISKDGNLLWGAGGWNTLDIMYNKFIWGNNGDENDGKPFGEVVE